MGLAGEKALEGQGDPLAALAGTSLRVYMLLLRSRRPLGVREVQRMLGFRSPSTARHHLERLVALGLAERVEGGYVARRPRGLLSLYVVVRGRLVPLTGAVAAFALGVAAAYTLLPGGDPVAAALLWAVASAATATAVYEARLVRGL